jgi:hypothetical protein
MVWTLSGCARSDRLQTLHNVFLRYFDALHCLAAIQGCTPPLHLSTEIKEKHS